MIVDYGGKLVCHNDNQPLLTHLKQIKQNQCELQDSGIAFFNCIKITHICYTYILDI